MAKRKKAGLNIQEFEVADLIKKTAEYNPRELDYEAEAGLNTSLNKFGYAESIVYNKKTKTLVSGHQRLRLLQKQGYELIDANVIDVDIATEKALNIALNAKTITGTFTAEVNQILDLILETDTEFYDMANLNSLYMTDEDLEEKDEKEIIEVDIPQMELSPYEHYDCILVVFKSVNDYMYLSSKLGLDEKRIISAPMVKNKKIGKTRAISADKIIDLLEGIN